MHEEQGKLRFPDGALPDEFRDLKFHWEDFDGFVAGLAIARLSGQQLAPEEVEPDALAASEAWRLLERFRRKNPELAEGYAEKFDFLEEMRKLLKKIAILDKEIPAPGI